MTDSKGIDWAKYTYGGGYIDLRRVVRENLNGFSELPIEDQNMMTNIFDEVEALTPITNRETAAVTLILAQQMLQMAQIIGSLINQLGHRLKTPEEIQIEKNKNSIQIVSSNRLPKSST